MSPSIPEIACTRCGRVWPATTQYFCRDPLKRNGLKSCCKKCNCEMSANWRKANPERHKAAKQRWERANPERRRELRRQDYWRNRNRARETQRRYYLRNKDAFIERNKKWQRENPERLQQSITARRHRRLARKALLPENFTTDDWQYALEYFNHCCAVCRRPVGLWHTLAADHWIPISSPNCPGTIPTNMLPLCHGVDGCNNHKAMKEPLEWLYEHFGKRKAKAILARIEAYFASVSSRDFPDES